MTMRIGTGVSTRPDPLDAAVEAVESAAGELDGAEANLALVFASGEHLGAPEAMLEGVHTAVSPDVMIGCGAGGVLGDGREHESGTALAVWLAGLPDEGRAIPFQATVDDDGTLEGMPPLSEATGVIMISDPYSFPTDGVLAWLADYAPGIPVLGGISSARTAEGGAALFLGDGVCEGGAVGVALTGVEMIPCVSQGAAPLGREATVTAADGNMIQELAGRPALETVEQIIAELTPHERALVAGGLLIGLVIDGGKPEYEQGDFLVRGLLGADRESGSIAVGAAVKEGQVIRLHARDAASATEDLRVALRLRVEALSGRPPAGALIFSCNGRGAAMFGVRDHDANAVEQELGGAPSAGFFAAGEIGPVGGRSFLHTFTATVGVFPQ
jgi:small ligand-binding sensory domain FIST